MLLSCRVRCIYLYYYKCILICIGYAVLTYGKTDEIFQTIYVN